MLSVPAGGSLLPASRLTISRGHAGGALCISDFIFTFEPSANLRSNFTSVYVKMNVTYKNDIYFERNLSFRG